MSYKKNIKSTFVTQVFLMAFGFITSVLIARSLGPQGQGQIAYFMLFFGMVAKFGNFGINDSLAYFIKKTSNDNKKIINNNFTFISLITFIYITIFSLFYINDLYLTEFSLSLLMLGCIYVYLNFLESNLKSIYMINEKTFISNNFKIFSTFLKFFITSILFLTNLITVELFIILNIFVIFLPVALMIKNLKFKFNLAISFKLIKDQLKYGFILYLSALMIFLTYKVDQFMIESYLGVRELGVYSIGVQLAELIFLIPHSIIIPLRGKLFNMKSADQVEKEKVTVLTTKLAMYICFLLAILGMLVSPIIPYIYGEGFSGSISITRILFIGIIFASIGKVASNYFYTEGITKIHLYITFMVLVVNIVLNLILIPSYGIDGAAIASTISYFLYGLLYIVIFIKRGNIKFSDFFTINKLDFMKAKSFIRRKTR